MRTAAPFILFAFFAIVLYLRAGQNPAARPRPPLTPRQRLRLIALGDPPVQGAADAFARYGFYAAWLIGLVGLVGNVIELLAPAGALFTGAGIVLVTDREVSERFEERERRGFTGRFTTGRSSMRFRGALLAVIGALWTVMGVAAAVG